MHLVVALPRLAVGLPHTSGLRVGELTPSSSYDPQLEISVETFRKGDDESKGKLQSKRNTRLTQVNKDMRAYAIESAMQDDRTCEIHKLMEAPLRHKMNSR